MSDEKDFNPIVAAMCMDMCRYDANEIVQQAADTGTEDNKGYNSDYADWYAVFSKACTVQGRGKGYHLHKGYGGRYLSAGG